MGLWVVHPEVGEAVAFVADEDGGGAGHGGVPVHLIGMRGGCDYIYLVGIEEVKYFLV